MGNKDKMEWGIGSKAKFNKHSRDISSKGMPTMSVIECNAINFQMDGYSNFNNNRTLGLHVDGKLVLPVEIWPFRSILSSLLHFHLDYTVQLHSRHIQRESLAMELLSRVATDSTER